MFRGESHSEVVFEFDGASVRILPAPIAAHESRSGLLLRHLKGSATVTMTTGEAMAATRGR